MNEEEIKHLIPFYVARTLGPEEQKAVEEALRQWPELQKDLEFWEKTSAASRLQAAFDAQAHPATEELVDYAEWTLKDPARRLAIDRHLQTCKTCSEAFALLKELEPERPLPKSSIVNRIVEFVKSFKPVYAVPAVVLTALVAVIIIKPLLRSPEDAQLWLTYEPETRGGFSAALPVLKLKEETEQVVFTICLPHNSETQATYDISLQPETLAPLPVASNAQLFYRGLPNDSLRVTVNAELFSRTVDNYQIIVTEDSLSVGGNVLPPFTLPFRVERRE